MTRRSRAPRTLFVLQAFICVSLVLASFPRLRAATPIVRVSVASNGTQANGSSQVDAISADGRFVVFRSSATNLVAGDTNGQADIFLHDTVTHTTTRALLAGGAVRSVDDVFPGDISADGRFVSFVTAASGIVAGDTNAGPDGFVYDFQTQQATRITVASDGTQSNGSNDLSAPRMSTDGRFVVFQSQATNLAQPNNGIAQDIFVHDRISHQTTQVSTGLNGAPANGFSVFAQISATGRFVAFSSAATNLSTQSDGNGHRDIYVHDRQTGITELASAGTGGVLGNGDAIAAAISADGRFVLFHSAASNLVPNDTNAVDDVFLRDRQTGQTIRISRSDAGTQANAQSFFQNLCISADGRFMTFISNATNLTAEGTAGTFLYDRALGRLQLASSVGAGQLSGDGRTFGFTSFQSNLVPGDTNAANDAFVTDLSSLEPALPTMALDRAALQFGATHTGAALAQQTPAQTVRLSQSGTGAVTWTATPTQPWITVSPALGTGPVVLNIGVQFSAGLPLAGTSAGSVTIALTGSGNVVPPISIALATVLNGTGANPAGVIDTPINRTTGVTGAVAVTGWALDDIGILRVRVMREPDSGTGALIFIGNAVFIDGARPDVAAAFPAAPLNSRAGWGYMLLTNFLPDEGNGTFTLHAIADDLDGHSVELGTTTITCANRTATRPFGAIDTPAQGEVIGGSAYANFGWVLARAPVLAYPPHGTVSVLVDGAPVTSPGGWGSRPDLVSLFPTATYPGVDHALGLAGLDTTTLTNGVHTIAWIVTDDNGQTDGVGSRFFTVSNGTLPAVAPASTARSTRPAASLVLDGAPLLPAIRDGGGPTSGASLADEVDAAPVTRAPIHVRTGFALDAPLHGVDGSPATIYGQQVDRFEIHHATDAQGAQAAQLTGYLRVDHQLGPLPIGSRLDQKTGAFTWLPGPGFLGAYDLVFVRWDRGRAVARREVRIVLTPAARNRVGAQVTIDAPAPNAVVDQPFMLGGWAIDPDTALATGVDMLHVWAYPRDRVGPPIFVGVTAYGGSRPDVAALFGERFRQSGYGLIVGSLPAGTYDLAVFAWSSATNDFVPARLVRVSVR
jgi:Tol biopolymer transport system component